MRRRDFIAGLSGLVAWPHAARAQQPSMPVVAYVRSTTAAGFAHLEAALRAGLKEAGFVEGQNVAVEFHYADDRTDRLSALIADLVRQPVNVIVGNSLAARAAKAATTTVPIVFLSGIDPVLDGLVASLNRPGGNVTGVNFLVATLGAKRLELLHRLVPKATTIAALVHRNSPQAETERRDLPVAAQARGLRLLILEVGSASDIDTSVASAVQRGVDALFIGGGAFFYSQRDRLVALAARHKLPASYPLKEAAMIGGLMSYAPSIAEAYRHAGIYVARILKGEKPADLPVMQSVKFEFVFNLKTARALGLAIPPTLLALADEVIE
ncbi:MAG: ABC transporter substrate-binding protein [Xanthobacteraceae bacterium]